MKGDIICKFKPTIGVLESFTNELSQDYRATCCANCHRSGKAAVKFPDLSYSKQNANMSQNDESSSFTEGSCLQYCGACKINKYCSPDCKMEDWSNFHEKECIYLREYTCTTTFAEYPTTRERTILRMLLFCAKSKSNYQRIMYLTSHLQEFISSQREPERKKITADTWKELRACFRRLNKFKQEVLTTSVTSYLKELDCSVLGAIMLVNALVMQNSFLEPTGLVFDPLLSLINHSCEPNVFFIFDDSKIKIVALTNLNKGQQIYVSYCYNSLPESLRRFDLKQRFFFTCQCKVCQKTPDRYMSLNCPHCQHKLESINLLKLMDGPYKALDIQRCVNCKENIQSIVAEQFKIYNKIFEIYWKCVINGSGLSEENKQELMLDKKASSDSYYEKKLTLADTSAKQLLLTEAVYGQFRPDTKQDRNRSINLIFKAQNRQVIPMYTFPIPQILAGLEAGVHDKMITVQILLINTFQVKIASDTNQFKPTIGHNLRELACGLFNIARSLKVDAKNLSDFDAAFPDQLVKTVIFLALNAYSYLVHLYNPEAEIIKNTKLLVCDIIRQASAGSLGESLRVWLAVGIDDKEFEINFGAILNKTSLQLVKRNGKYQFSNRSFAKIFFKCDELPLEKFSIKRRSVTPK